MQRSSVPYNDAAYLIVTRNTYNHQWGRIDYLQKTKFSEIDLEI